MKIGEKIQELRKKAGLSQEGLAEQLGVSRQAISKWESGAAMPTIDNIIELSRIFNIAVGELLQVEPTAGVDPTAGENRQGEKEAGSGISTEGLLAFLKEQEAQRRLKERRSRRAAAAVLAVVVLACGVTLFNLNGRLNVLFDKFGNVDSKIMGINGALTYEIANISQELRQRLDEQVRITADYSYQVKELDLKNERVTLHITALPRSYVKGMTAEFTAQASGEKPIMAAGVLEDMGTFACDMTVALNDEIRLSVGFVQSGQTQNQLLEIVYGLRSDNRMEISSAVESGRIRIKESGRKLGFQECRVQLKVSPAYGNKDQKGFMLTNWPVKADVVLMAGERVLKKFPMDLSDTFDERSTMQAERYSDSEFYFYVSMDGTFEVASKEEISMKAVVVDNYGIRREVLVENIDPYIY